MAGFEIKDGEYTKTIYSMIKEQRFVRRFAASDQITISFFSYLRYIDAIQVLSMIYDSHPTSRASLSLLAYCYFYTQVRDRPLSTSISAQFLDFWTPPFPLSAIQARSVLLVPSSSLRGIP